MSVRVRFHRGSWWVFIAHRGRRRSKKVGDRKTALTIAAKIREKLTLGDLSLLGTATEGIDKYARAWLKAGEAARKKSTKKKSARKATRKKATGKKATGKKTTRRSSGKPAAPKAPRAPSAPPVAPTAPAAMPPVPGPAEINPIAAALARRRQLLMGQ